MNESATSLDLLYDLVLPPEVPWWPLAPGWYVVIGLLILGAVILLVRLVLHYRANAYRRAALRQLAAMEDPAAIAELLRRTALAIAPRPTVAQKTGSAWLDWLARQSPEPLTETIREHLTAGVYGRPVAHQDFSALCEFATRWIANHRRPVMTDDPPRC